MPHLVRAPELSDLASMHMPAAAFPRRLAAGQRGLRNSMVPQSMPLANSKAKTHDLRTAIRFPG